MEKIVKIYKLSEYQTYLKCLLYFFDDFCCKNSIEYSVIDGTLLGAIRHKDIIPWDDDVDVIMSRDNLEKLKKSFDNYHGRYYLNYLPNHRCKRGGKRDYLFLHCQLVDKKASTSRYNIDIFTYDFVGNDYKTALKAFKKSRFFWRFSSFSITFHFPPLKKSNSHLKNVRNLLVRVFYPFLFLLSKLLSPLFVWLYSKFENKYLSFESDSKYILIEPFLGRFPVTENSFVGKGIQRVPFGIIEVYALIDYEPYLKATYGDYMQIPSESKRLSEHSNLENNPMSINLDEELETILEAINE